jgi:hypothetical protein
LSIYHIPIFPFPRNLGTSYCSCWYIFPSFGTIFGTQVVQILSYNVIYYHKYMTDFNKNKKIYDYFWTSCTGIGFLSPRRVYLVYWIIILIFVV